MKKKEQSEKARRARVDKEMAKPRVARSARIAQLNLDTDRIPELPSASVPGTVLKIIPPNRRGQPESAKIGLDAPDERNRDLRIENTLTNEHGQDVKLKKGARVDVNVTARDQTSTEEPRRVDGTSQRSRNVSAAHRETLHYDSSRTKLSRESFTVRVFTL
jgi:hypothetical protein